MKRNRLVVIGAVIGIPILMFLMISMPANLMLLMTIFAPTDPKPQITYGEFPFTVEYELNGEVLSVTDTVICKFDGYYTGEMGRKRRSWDSYLKSGEKYVSLYQTEDIEILISLGLGSMLGQTYMGDPNRKHDKPDIVLGYREIIDGKPGEFDLISEKDLWEKYKLKLIHVKFSDPIENSFE